MTKVNRAINKFKRDLFLTELVSFAKKLRQADHEVFVSAIEEDRLNAIENNLDDLITYWDNNTAKFVRSIS